MKNNFTIQEILLNTGTQFSAREFLSKDEKLTGAAPTAKEKLAEACWNGMLVEMLPEICIIENNQPLTLWELAKGIHIFYLKMGEADIEPDAFYSLNPYTLMLKAIAN